LKLLDPLADFHHCPEHFVAHDVVPAVVETAVVVQI
jgi:hypothetical protein